MSEITARLRAAGLPAHDNRETGQPFLRVMTGRRWTLARVVDLDGDRVTVDLGGSFLSDRLGRMAAAHKALHDDAFDFPGDDVKCATCGWALCLCL